VIGMRRFGLSQWKSQTCSRPGCGGTLFVANPLGGRWKPYRIDKLRM
jgi:hypothetical protein